MAEKNFSCIKQIVKTVQIPLPSTFISNEISGIAEILDSWKRQYSKQLQGVVVNYKNLSLSPNGFLVPNKPFVYYNVKATFDLFSPKIGDIVQGKISHISKKHILCLIEGTISVSIHLFNDSPNEVSSFLYINQEILFEISSLKFDMNMILNVKGKITQKCIDLMKEYFPPPAFNNLVDTPEFSNNTDEGIGTGGESADDGLLNHVLDDSKTYDDTDFKKPLSSSTKSRKSKRPKSESDSSTMDTSDSLSSDKKPKKKKRKHSLNENNLASSDTFVQNLCKEESEFPFMDVSEQSTSDEMPKKKKKHKDKSTPLIEKEIKNELPDDETISSFLLSIKKEISSPVKTTDNFVPKSKKKSKDKKSKERDKSKKKKGKVLASGAVLKKDKKSKEKSSKKNKLDGKESKKHKKGKNHKKDKSDKKKKKTILKEKLLM